MVQPSGEGITMAQIEESRRVAPSPPPPSAAWTGWVVFAAVMMAVTGGLNLIQGLVALLDDGYFLVRSGDRLLVADYSVWGWIMLAWGAVLLAAGISLVGRHAWARWFALFAACMSIVVQVGFLSAYPIWSAILIAFDVLVILALTVHWDEARGV